MVGMMAQPSGSGDGSTITPLPFWQVSSVVMVQICEAFNGKLIAVEAFGANLTNKIVHSLTCYSHYDLV